MKIRIYHFLSFLAVPALMILLEVLNQMGCITMRPALLALSLIILCSILGNCSPCHGNFDTPLTILLPLSLLCTMFLAGFLDKDDLETRFHLYKAIRAAFQPICLLLYPLLSISAAVSSAKPIRRSHRHFKP